MQEIKPQTPPEKPVPVLIADSVTQDILGIESPEMRLQVLQVLLNRTLVGIFTNGVKISAIPHEKDYRIYRLLPQADAERVIALRNAVTEGKPQ